MREGHILLVFFVLVIAMSATLDHRVNALELSVQKSHDYDDKLSEALDEAYLQCNKYAELDKGVLMLTPVEIKKRVTNNQNIYNQESITKYCEYFYEALTSKFSLNDKTNDKLKKAASILVFVDMDRFYITFYDGEEHKMAEYSYKDADGLSIRIDKDTYTQIWDQIDKTLTYYINAYGNNGSKMDNTVMASLDLNMDKTHFTWDKLAGTYAFFYYKGVHDKSLTRYNFSRLISKNISTMHYYWISPNKSSGLPEYHVSGSDCEDNATDWSNIKFYNSIKECAAEGAYPCSDCLGVTFTQE